MTLNGGSSSIKFAFFQVGYLLRWILKHGIKMNECQLVPKVREYFHKQSPAI